MRKVFLAKIKDSDDRDVVYYVKFKGFECEHYFGGLQLCGACFCGFEKELRDIVESNFDNLETILTKEEMCKMFELNDKIKELGYGIERDSEKYNKGVAIIDEYNDTIGKKLLSDENEQLYEKVVKDEKEFVKRQYDLTDSEVDDIFDNYFGGYQDRAIVSYVFNDIDELVEEEKFELGYEDIKYFDDDAFGRDLLESEYYYELDNGRIVAYSY